MTLQTRLADLIGAIKGDYNGLDARIAALEGAGGGGGAKPIFPIWAEENGGMSANAWEVSFGNGATGNDIGISIPIPCQLEYVTVNADAPGTSITVKIWANGAAGTLLHTTPPLSNNGIDTLATPVAWTPGNAIVFQTGALVGSWNDVRFCAWFREL